VPEVLVLQRQGCGELFAELQILFERQRDDPDEPADDPAGLDNVEPRRPATATDAEVAARRGPASLSRRKLTESELKGFFWYTVDATS